MEKECSLSVYFKEKYAGEIQEIITREQVSPEVAVCSYLCPEVIGCVEDVEEKACALRLRAMKS
ncbi:MAG: hypothetical protein JL50_14190 [Peptococcaceae bacterium BICA1-7]|nr:MAG: hypothetical protein JL50_14190 [Peptococcaceae bacterium BICA1-7]HBV96409.1 hypothetical protein [Desulfotomaculum sp.]